MSCPPATGPVAPSLSSVTDLGTLTVSKGRASPLFNPAVTDYDVGVVNGTTIVTVAAEPASSVAKLTIDGTAVASKDIAITGDTPVAIVVTAQDGSKKTYSVIIKPAATATVDVDLLVVESINGTVLPGAVITVEDANGSPVAATDTSGAAGLANVSLAPDAFYTLYSTKADYGQNAYSNFYVDALGGNTVTMVNQKLGMTGRAATAPIILGYSITHDENFSDLAAYNGEPLDTTGTCYLIATVAAENAVEATAWSGFGAKFDFDNTPTTFNGIDGYLLEAPENVSMPGYWISEFLFDLSGFEVSAGMHKAVVVAYDVANNRCETSMVVDVANNPAGAAISAGVFSGMTIDVRSFPVSRGYFGKDTGSDLNALSQYLGKDVSYRTQLTFMFTDGKATPANIPIRGFDVYRSTDGVSFTKVGTQQYGYLSTGSSGVHSYFDTDSKLVEGGTYTYKVVAYTSASKTKESGVVSTKLMAPFAANLATPANQAAISTTGGATNPAYTFTVSNTTLWNAAVSDYFYFELTITEKTGALKYLGKYRYDFAVSLFQYFDAYSGTWEDTGPVLTYAAGTLTISSDLPEYGGSNLYSGSAMVYDIGTAYEWDIIGALKAIDGADHPAWFQKSSTGGIAKSYGDGYSEGANTMNGRFEFSVSD